MERKILRKVKDRFNLFNDGRKLNSNKRKYVIKAVQSMIEAAQTNELLRLGEAYGYYGHQPRQRANKLSIGETEVINIKGRPVVVENVPSNCTTSLSCSDDGIVTHEQDIFDTPTGRIIDSLIKSGVGGWSWATSGRDGSSAGGECITNNYYGMDYVLQPNYLSLDHPQMMMESTQQHDKLLESLASNGFDDDSADNIIKSFSRQTANPERIAELETETMYLEGVNASLEEEVKALKRGKDMLLEAVESLPFYLTTEQKDAISNLSSERDLKVISMMFESVGDKKLKTFEPANATVSATGEKMKHEINYSGTRRRFS